MAKVRKSVLGAVLVGAALVLSAGFVVAHRWKAASKPLRDGPPVEFPSVEISPLARQRFLDGDFAIVKDVRALPRPVLQLFTEQAGSRLLMANPGKEFEATDVIYDSSLPRKRLIFGGVSDDKCFVHYEQGGLGHMYILAFFRVTSEDSVEPLWRGFCGPAANIEDLRSQVLKGDCSESVPQRMR
jgi:hypothetical protein